MADRTGQIRHSISVAGGLSIENCQRAYFKSQEAREAMLMNNQTTMAPTTPMMLTSSSSDFGLDFLSQNDSFNKSLEIDLSVLNDIGVDFHLILKQENFFAWNKCNFFAQIPVDLSQVPDIKVPWSIESPRP